MRFSTISFFLLIGAVALVQAGPVAKAAEKKSASEETTKLEKKEAPAIEESGDQKDRAKKSATSFCLEIRPGSDQPVQTSCGCNGVAQPVQSLNLVQPAPPVHTLHIVPAAQPAQAPCQILPAPQVQPTLQPVAVQTPPPPPPPPTSTPAPAPKPEVPHYDRIIEHIPQPPQIIHMPMPEPSETINIMPVMSPQPAPQPMVVMPSEPLVLVPQQEEVEHSIAPATPPPQPSVPQCTQCHHHHLQCPSRYQCPLHHCSSDCGCEQSERNMPLFRSAVEAARMVMNPAFVESSNRFRHHHLKHDRYPMYTYSSQMSAPHQKSPLMVQCSPRITSLDDNMGQYARHSETSENGEAGDMTRSDVLEGRRATFINLHPGYNPQTDQQQQAIYQTIPSGYPYSSLFYPNSHHVAPGAPVNAYPQVNYANAVNAAHQLYPDIAGQPTMLSKIIGSPFPSNYRSFDGSANKEARTMNLLEEDSKREKTFSQKQTREILPSLLTEEAKEELKVVGEDARSVQSKEQPRSTRSDKDPSRKVEKPADGEASEKMQEKSKN